MPRKTAASVKWSRTLKRQSDAYDRTFGLSHVTTVGIAASRSRFAPAIPQMLVVFGAHSHEWLSRCGSEASTNVQRAALTVAPPGLSA